MNVALESAQWHPNLQLEGQAFPQLPQDAEAYIDFFEVLTIRVDSLAEGLVHLMRYGS